MNILKFTTSLAIATFSLTIAVSQPNQDLNSNQFCPAGWAEEFLVRQQNGLGSHPNESGFPFNTQMWLENMNYLDREISGGGDDWWPYEQSAYYLDGSLRCGYMLNSEVLLGRAIKNLEHILDGATDDGMLHANDLGVDREGWPMVIAMRLLVEQYEVTKDPALLEAITKHYKALYKTEDDFVVKNLYGFEIRPVLHIELLCAMYGNTGDRWFIDAAEKLYQKFQEQTIGKGGVYMLTAKAMAEDVKPAGHAVTYQEFMKLPIILYMYTGKEEYKGAFYTAYNNLDEYELANGAYANNESLAKRDPNESSETCSVIDANWTSGWALLATGDPMFADDMEKMLYNACFSAIKKDFKAYQYYIMPNLLISTNSSSFYNDDVSWGADAKGRVCYRPGHDTECCAGNIHRMLPTYINRSTIINGDNVKLALYLPGTTTVDIQGDEFAFTQNTNYPFEHKVNIVIDKAPSKRNLDFGLRIPSWADSYTIALNGKEVMRGTDSQVFKNISRKFKAGDVVDIEFKTTPKIDDRGAGLAINYGALVFSYPIEANVRKSTSCSGNKCSHEYPAYEYTPKDMINWAVGLPSTLKAEDIEVVENKSYGYPWDENNSPVRLRVKGRKVTNWALNKYIESTAYPQNVECGDEVTLELVPTSSAILKITEFPKY